MKKPDNPNSFTPEQRVEAYIADWYKTWCEMGGQNYGEIFASGMDFSDFFSKWDVAIKQVTKAHWVPDAPKSIGQSFGTPPDHDPSDEKVIGIDHSNGCVVTTSIQRGYPPRRDYQLKQQDGKWLIAKVLDRYSEGNKPYYTAEELQEYYELTRSDPSHLPEASDEPNLEALFEKGREFKGDSMEEAERVRLKTVGTLSVPSGALVVQDLGHPIDRAAPLTLRFPPGDYLVDIAVLSNRPAAARLVIEPTGTSPYSYRQAGTVAGTHWFSVDAGNLAICDFAAFMGRSERECEDDYELWTENFRTPESFEEKQLMHLGQSESATAAVITSGYGDGSYPAYWVLDANERPLWLVLDFLIASRAIQKIVTLPWNPDGVEYEGNLLKMESGGSPFGMVFEKNMQDMDSDREFVHTGDLSAKFEWLDESGNVVANNHGGGLTECGDEKRYTVDTAAVMNATSIRITICVGYRN